MGCSKGTVLLLIVLLASANPAYAAEAPWESAYNAEPFAGGVIRDVFCDLVGLIQGSFGALLLSTAALMAIGGAAFGDFTSAKTAIVVGVSSATIAAGVSLYFGDFGCGLQGGEATNRAVQTDTQRAAPAEAQEAFNPFE